MNDVRTPYDPEAEISVAVTALFHSDKVMARIAAILQPKHFMGGKARALYEACLALFEARQPIDVVTIASWLRERDKLIGIFGGMAGYTKFYDEVPTVHNPESYARTVINRYRERQIQRLSLRNAAEATEDHGDTQTWIDGHIKDLMIVAQENCPPASESNAEAMRRIWSALSLAQDGPRSDFGNGYGVRIGLATYDAMTGGGLAPGQMTILAARPGVGKTSLVLQIASALSDQGIASAFFSTEMGRDELHFKQWARKARVDSNKIKSKLCSSEEWQRLLACAGSVGDQRVWIDDTPGIHAGHVRERVIGFLEKARIEKVPLGAVFVDYAQRLIPLPKMELRKKWEQVGANAKQLKLIAQEYKLPIVVLAQLSREADKVERPDLSCLADSSELEKEADCVVMLYGKRNSQTINLSMIKNRNGSTFDMHLKFEREFSNFVDVQGDYR